MLRPPVGPRQAGGSMPAPDLLDRLAGRVIDRCDRIAGFTERPGTITRTFLSPPMRGAIEAVAGWRGEAGMIARVDAGGNLVGLFPGETPDAPALMVGSHL